MGTPFSEVYNRFLNKITDDMYLELTPADTLRDLQHIIADAIPGFEFPRKNLLDYCIDIVIKPLSEEQKEDFVLGPVLEENDDVPKILVDNSYFAEDLTSEEINILAILMLQNWVQRQVTSIENTRMKYSGSDFKFTSQANHLQKLMGLLKEIQYQSHHMQRLYKRRRFDDAGRYESNWSVLREVSAVEY